MDFICVKGCRPWEIFDFFFQFRRREFFIEIMIYNIYIGAEGIGSNTDSCKVFLVQNLFPMMTYFKECLLELFRYFSFSGAQYSICFLQWTNGTLFSFL